MTVPETLLGEREVESPADMEALGRELGAHLDRGDVVVLTGPLGAGKTTLTRGIAAALDVRGPIQSPTFVIARTHPSLSGGAPLVHVDAYRLGSAAEIDDLDIDVPGSVVIVEWGHDHAALLADQWWEVEIDRRAWTSSRATHSPRPEELDADAPRHVTISHRTATVPSADADTLEG